MECSSRRMRWRAARAIVVASGDQPDGVQVPWLTVTDSRLALAELSAAFNGDPSQELTVVGVTGTNGKTTTTYLLASIFEAAGKPCGRIGSVGYYTGAGEKTAQWTTPEAPDVQALLREMVDHRCAACAVEVSSHALAMRRVDGTRFAAGVFSNLTRDHLDYHLDMEHYFSTKQRLFDMLEKAAPAVINIDDPYGMRLASVAGRPVTYSLNGSADVTLDRLESTMDGSSLDIVSPRGRCRVRTRLPGRLNVYNVLAAVAAAVALDVPLEAIEVGVAGLEGVPGRFETVSSPADDVRVIVDFAHTDDAPARHADGSSGVVRRTGNHRVRLRRRPRHGQTAADGRRRGAAQRPGRGDVGQSAVRGSGSHHR